MNIKSTLSLFAFCGILFSQLASASRFITAEDSDAKHKTRVQADLALNRNGKQSITIKYLSDINVCHNGGDVSGIDLEIVFVVGEGSQAQYYKYPIYPICPNNGANASITFDSEKGLVRESWSGPSDPQIWDRVFPKNAEGNRWFALRVGFIRSHRGTGYIYDNKNGADYRLIFE